MEQIDIKKLKFVDEAGAVLNMTRLYGRSAIGQRVVDSVPHNYGDNHSMIAALSLEGIGAPMVISGAIDGDVFKTWVNIALCPTLKPGDVVIWDNLSAHRVAGVEEAIAATGAKLLPLSPYSPDYNPIENCWSKIKTFLRKAKARTTEALIEAIKQALETVNKSDIIGWFAHCGYGVR